MELKRDKATLRDQIGQRRKRLAQATVARASEAICEQVLALPAVRDAGCVMSYVSLGNEVATHDLIRTLLARGKQLAVPLLEPETGTIVPRIIFDFDSDLRTGSYGILEPRPKRSEPCDLTRLRVVLVPGVAFDAQGNRLGRGGGHFDRFLARLSSATKIIALAYDFQVVPSVPYGPHDEAVHLIVTEKRLIEPPRHL